MEEDLASVDTASASTARGRGTRRRQKPNDGPFQRLQKNHELHEVKELEKMFKQLDGFGLSIDDYFLTQEESVSGEKLATNTPWSTMAKTTERGRRRPDRAGDPPDGERPPRL